MLLVVGFSNWFFWFLYLQTIFVCFFYIFYYSPLLSSTKVFFNKEGTESKHTSNNKRQNRNHHHFQKKIKIESLLLWFTLFITPLYGSFAVTVAAAVVVDGVFSSMILLLFGLLKWRFFSSSYKFAYISHLCCWKNNINFVQQPLKCIF